MFHKAELYIAESVPPKTTSSQHKAFFQESRSRVALLHLVNHQAALTQVCYVRFLDIKQNGRRTRGTIIFRFILCLNVGRLSKNSRNSICPIYTWLRKRQKFAITSTNHVWLVFSAPYENISKGKKAVVRISDFGHENRFK